MTKVCTKCGKEKSLGEFSKRNTPKGVQSWCKECERIKSRKWRKANPEKFKEAVRRHHLKHPEVVRAAQVKRSFGVTLEEYDKYYSEAFKKQDGRCIICGIHASERRLVLDHDHSKSGIDAFRDLLCDKCNLGIGFLDDDLVKLKGALDYLKKHN